ncbi:MAG: DsbA family protein [Thermodesulfobacteriota bacterium]
MLSPHLLSRSSFVVCTLALVSACGGDGSRAELDAIRRELAAVRSAQEAMAGRIGELEKTLEASQARPRAVADAPRTEGVVDLPIDPSPQLGRADAPVTVVEFADFQCPYCKAASGFPKQLVAAFPDGVRFVFKHYPLHHHADAWPAAEAAWAAHQQGKFWEMHDLIFAGDTTRIGTETLRGYAEQLGLDMARFDRDMASRKADRFVSWDKKTGRGVKVSGTPTYFVNGRRASKPDPATIRAMVSEEIAKAQQAAPG